MSASSANWTIAGSNPRPSPTRCAATAPIPSARWPGRNSDTGTTPPGVYSLRTGKPSFDHVFGMPIFEWFGKHPERSAVFNQSMSELTRTVEPAVCVPSAQGTIYAATAAADPLDEVPGM